MRYSDDLFQLIRTMTKSEKRYFKLYSSIQKGEKFYLRLFDEINKQKNYDEEKIVFALNRKKDTAWFSVAKSRLYNLILKSMENCYVTAFSEVKSCIHRADILYSKGLYAQCQKLVDKAKTIASQHEMHHSLLEISRYRDMELALQKIEVKKMKQIMKRESQELDLLQNTKQYRDLFFEIAIQRFRYGTTRSKKSLKKIEKIIQHPLLKKESDAKTFEAKVRYNDSYAFYWDIKGNAKQAFHYAKKIIHLFSIQDNKNPAFILKYFMYLNNVQTQAILLKKYNDAFRFLKLMREQKNFLLRNYAGSGKIYFFYSIDALNYYNCTGQFAESIPELNQIDKEEKQYESRLNELQQFILWTRIAITYFGLNKTKKSIYWLNRIRDEISLPVLPDLQCFFKIFYLIIHYEAGHDDLISYLTKSTHLFLEKKKYLYKFERMLLDFFKNKFPKTNTRKELTSAFQELKNKVRPLTQDKYEKNVFQYFDFISWLESKIENRPFAEVVKEKAAKQQEAGSRSK